MRECRLYCVVSLLRLMVACWLPHVKHNEPCPGVILRRNEPSQTWGNQQATIRRSRDTTQYRWHSRITFPYTFPHALLLDAAIGAG